MHKIDRRRVRHAFGRQASSYETYAAVQKRVVARFLECLKRENLAPEAILDVGAGSGMLLRALRQMYSDARAAGIDSAEGMTRTARRNLALDPKTVLLTADAEHLPFRVASFDLVVSTSTYQWLADLDGAFGEVFRVLEPGGSFAFALFGGETLHELHSSYDRALTVAGRKGENRMHRFFTESEVAAALQRTGFAGLRIFSELEVEVHGDVPDLLRSLKLIGAGNASPSPARGLGGRPLMLAMMKNYREDHGDDGGVRATYHIVYGFCRKPQQAE
jgi:malonyl-CoA O-methyltransferase